MPGRGFEFRIRRIYLWTMPVCVVSCVVGVVALGSPAWTEGSYGDYEFLQTGLLVFCHHRRSGLHVTECAPLLFGGEEKWLEAARLMSLLSWVVVLTVLVTAVVLHVQDPDHHFSLPTVLVGLVAGAMGLTAAIVYVIGWTTQTVVEKYDVTISWGYAVCVLWHVITLFMFGCLAVASRDIWATQLKLRRRH